MLQDIEVLAGALLVAAVLLDVYLTVLYARAGISVFSRFVCTRIWKLLRVLARRFGRRAGVVLSLAGPAVVVSLVLLWALLLTTGAALVFHPFLGSAIRKSGGSTPTDFISALYVAGNSMSIVGSSGYEPATAAFRLLFLFNSLMGMSVISLTLTYVMQIYGALQTRNAVGLRLFLMSGMTTRSAEMLARIAPRGHFDQAYSTLSELAAELANLKENHHFYPVLLYFRFAEPYYSVSYITSSALDCVSLIESALDERQCGWLQESAVVVAIWEASLLLITLIERSFSPLHSPADGEPVDAEIVQWRGDYMRAVGRLKEAGIPIAADAQEGAGKYADLRGKWAARVRILADAMLYRPEEVDPARENPPTRDRAVPPWSGSRDISNPI